MLHARRGLRRVCSTMAMRARIDALEKQISDLGHTPAPAAAPEREPARFVGAPKSEYTTDLQFLYPHVDGTPPTMPCFRLINDLGEVQAGAEVPELDEETMLGMQATMVRVSEFDKVFNDAQRQGRISFYMTSRGEEACSVASAAALHAADFILPQYRELGAAFWRGITFDDAADQLCSNGRDPARGRQLPLHLGAREHNFFCTPLPAPVDPRTCDS